MATLIRRAPMEGNKPAKLKAIAEALKACEKVIIATDYDREGQLIGQEIIEHLRFRGTSSARCLLRRTRRPSAKLFPR
jgi:DNA topoisomerase IA